MFDNRPHPRAEQLASFALGQLHEGELARVAKHLETCALCLATIDTTAGDGFVDLLRSADSPERRSAPCPLHAGYEILEPLGQGGMGIVYKARQLGLGRIVALKRMRYAELGSAEELARFRAEAEVMARLTHPHIVQVFEVGEQDGSPFLACEFVPGRGLDSFLRGTPLPPRSAAQLVATLARAAHAAHQHAIVHRDLKPSNVLIAWPGAPLLPDEGDDFWAQAIPKITDFGLAKRLDAVERHTQTNAVLGTPEYMAPEQAGGQSRLVGPATDVHALGVILYEALTGSRPFQGTHVGDTLRLVREAEPTPPRRLRPRLARDLEVICLKCLEKDPDRRYAAAEALAHDLEAWLGGRTIVAKPPSRWDRTVKWVRRNAARTTAALLAVTLVCGAVLGGAAHLWRLRAEAIRANTAEAQALDNVRSGYQAVDRLIREWSRDAPTTAAWRARDVQLKDQALTFLYDAASKTTGSDPHAQLTRGMLLTYAGSAQRTLQRYELARRDLQRAAEVLQPLCQDHACSAEARDHQSNCRYNLGLSLAELKQPAEAERELLQSLELLGAEASSSNDLSVLSRVAMRQEGLGMVHIASGQTDRALDCFRAAIGLRRRMLAIAAEDVRNRLQFADDCRLFAVAVFASKGREYDEAGRLLEEAEAVLRSEFEQRPLPPVAKAVARLADVRCTFEVNRGQVEQGLARCDQGIAAAQAALAQESHDFEAKGWLHSLHRTKAYTLCRLHRFSEALPHWDAAIQFADGESQLNCRIERALERALAGDYRQATDETTQVVAGSDVPSGTLRHAARVYSRAIEEVHRDSLLEEVDRSRAIADYAQRGLECLKRSTRTASPDSAAATLFDFAELDADPALKGLRATDQYHTWRKSQSLIGP